MRALLLALLLCSAAPALAGGPHMNADEAEAPATISFDRHSPPDMLGADMARPAEALPPSPDAALDPTDHPGAYAKAVYNAATHKNYRFLVAFALLAFVSVSRRYASRLPGRGGAFVASDRGGAMLTIVLAISGGATTALLGGGPLSFEMVGNAVMNAVIAAGGYSLVKKADPIGLARSCWRRKAPEPQKSKGKSRRHRRAKGTK